MSRLSGTVTLSGSAVSGATVFVIDTDSNSVVATETTDSNGDWEATGLAQSASERYHALVQYDDGSTKYNAESLPFLSTPGIIQSGAVNVNVDSPTPSITAESVIPDSVVDNYNDFDSESPGIYESGDTLSTYYSGDVGEFARTTSDVVEGSHALAYADSSDDDNHVIYSGPGDGLNQYPDPGDTLRVFLRAPMYTEFVFGIDPSGPAGYTATLGSHNNDMRIRRLDDLNTITDLTASSPSLTGTDWYWAEIRTPSSGDSSITFDLYELDTTDLSRGSNVDSLSTSDSNYTGQAIGARLASNLASHTAIDDIRVI